MTDARSAAEVIAAEFEGVHRDNALWLANKVLAALSEAGWVVKKRRVRVKMCDECGKHPADLPSTVCVGCEAYKEHTAIY
jgi:hypothetical protein